MKKVALLGSCVTRNTFNTRFTDYKARYSLVLEQYQTSLISVMAAPILPPSGVYDGFDGFELRAMKGEIEKTFAKRLAEACPDVIIVDLYTDAMFGCVPFQDSYITLNRWRLREKPAAKLIDANSGITPWNCPKLFHALLKEASEKFSDLVAHSAADAIVVLNCARAVQHWRTADNIGEFEEDITAFNEEWETADAIFRECVPCSSIEMPGKVLGDGAHMHGRSNVHYEASYHEYFLTELDHLVNHKQPCALLARS
jgi:hypothetical protein